MTSNLSAASGAGAGAICATVVETERFDDAVAGVGGPADGRLAYFLFKTIVIWPSPIGPLAERFTVITLPSRE